MTQIKKRGEVPAPIPREGSPRILYLSFDVGYLNPTRQLLALALARSCDLVLYGPGYSSPQEVTDGPEAFAKMHGPFDIVMGDEYALIPPGFLPDDQKHLLQFYYHACRFDPMLIHEGSRYFTFMKSFRGPRVIALLQTDYYNLMPDAIARMEEIGDYYLSWGPEFLLAKSQVTSAGVSESNGYLYERWNDNYRNFVTRRSDRIISTPHFVAASEMAGGPLHGRRHDWSVLGSSYSARVEARRLLDGIGRSRSGKAIPKIFAAADRLGVHLFNKFWALRLMNELHLRAIRAAKFGFTCGSILRWPLRKYMEIPGNGAVLAAEACTGFAALGFQDRVNAVACDARDVLDADAWLKADLGRAQRIADRGRALIERRHSVAARAEQFAESLRRIKAKQFAGSYWEEGELRFRSSVAQPLRVSS
jgi:hypothetical protein